MPSARTNKMACSNGFAHPTIESPGMQVTSSLNPPDMRKVRKQGISHKYQLQGLNPSTAWIPPLKMQATRA